MSKWPEILTTYSVHYIEWSLKCAPFKNDFHSFPHTLMDPLLKKIGWKWSPLYNDNFRFSSAWLHNWLTLYMFWSWGWINSPFPQKLATFVILTSGGDIYIYPLFFPTFSPIFGYRTFDILCWLFVLPDHTI